jgi:hypothetical protein
VTRKLGLVVLAALLLMTPHAAAKGPLAPKTVFGIVWQSRQTSVAKLDALTLRPVSRAAPLGKAGHYLGRSPGNGVRAAFGIGEAGDAIRFVDLKRMRPEGRVGVPCSIGGPILWEEASYLVTTCGGAASSVLVVDPVTRKLRSRRAISGSLVNVQAAEGRLVGLLAPLDKIGAARLIVVDGRGRSRIVALPGIRAGTEVLDQETYRARIEQPAVAVHPSGQWAVVVPASGAVVQVDLGTLAVLTHSLSVRAPAAVKKQIEGTQRSAVWTWSNTIAVSGMDATADGQADHHWTPAGLTLIDADTWSSRIIDPGAAGISSTGSMLLSWAWMWDSNTRTAVGTGLTGYDADGNQRFHLFGTEALTFATVIGTYVYVASEDLRQFQIVDTVTGKIVRTVRTAKPMILAPMRETF